MNKKSEIFELLRKVAVLKDKEVTNERIQMFVGCLEDYNLSDIRRACKNLAFGSKFFPDISEIINEIENPVDDRDSGVVLAGEILDALRRYGPLQGADVQRDLGDFAWHIITRFGGWQSLCAITYDEMPSARAQLRDLIASTKKVNRVFGRAGGHTPKISTGGQLKRIGDFLGGALE